MKCLGLQLQLESTAEEMEHRLQLKQATVAQYHDHYEMATQHIRDLENTITSLKKERDTSHEKVSSSTG